MNPFHPDCPPDCDYNPIHPDCDDGGWDICECFGFDCTDQNGQPCDPFMFGSGQPDNVGSLFLPAPPGSGGRIAGLASLAAPRQSCPVRPVAVGRPVPVTVRLPPPAPLR